MPFGSLHLQENYSRIRHPSCAFCRSFRRTSRKSCRSRRSRRNDSRPRDGGCGGAWRPLHPEMGRRQWEAAPVGFQTLIYPYMNPNIWKKKNPNAQALLSTYPREGEGSCNGDAQTTARRRVHTNIGQKDTGRQNYCYVANEFHFLLFVNAC